MFNHRTLAIIKREIKTQVMSKSFIIMTILMPTIMFAFIGFQIFVQTFESKDKVNLVIVEETPSFNEELKARLDSADFVMDTLFTIDYRTMGRSEFDTYLDESKAELIDEKITGIVFIPDSARFNKRGFFYSTNPSNRDITNKIRIRLNQVLIKSYFSEKDISEDDLRFAQRSVRLEANRVSEDGIEKEGFSSKIVAFAFTLLLYFSLIFIGQQLLVAVNQEKTSRVVEILLSSATSQELMTGKIVGTTLTGLLQMTIWVLPLILLSLGSAGPLADFTSLNISINMMHIVYFLLNFFIALLTFLGLFAAIGSIIENPQDAQSSIFPVLLLIIIPFFLTFTMAKNPANSLAEIASMLPFASLIVMPARLTLLNLPFWQIGLAAAVNLATLYFVLKLVGKIYRVGILMTGKRPTWPEVYKWLKYQN